MVRVQNLLVSGAAARPSNPWRVKSGAFPPGRRKGGFFASLALGILAVLPCSCAQWLLPPLRVLSCSLEEERGGLFFRFSASPKEESILKAFSMTEDGRRLEGRFVFAGEETRFYPVNGIGEGRTYRVSLSTVAEDRQGNSLEEDYHREFFTGAGGKPPG